MDIFAPLYYKNFKCIADKCSHSCCIAWQIDVDSVTVERYQSLPDGKRAELLSHMEEEDGITHIKLCENGNCPFLDENSLCRIISTLGENYISEICREHPRFYNRTMRGIEAGLGLVCEEACRIVLASDEFYEFEKIGQRECDSFEGYDALPHRDFLLALLSDKAKSYEEKLCEISNAYNVSAEVKPISYWLSIIDSLEFMDDKNRSVFAELENKNSLPTACAERFLAYLIMRYVTCSESYDNLRARLGFSLLGARLMQCACSSGEFPHNALEFARIFSEEIEYSEDNVETLIFEFECLL